MVKDTETAKSLLEGAYALTCAEDNVNYYRNFASVYDDQYVTGMGYTYPDALAQVYLSRSESTDVPVVDIGCGTGLVAVKIELPCARIDGVDISPEMLKVADGKSLYRKLYQHDLTNGVDGLPDHYGAVISAGTFTFGHLGPEVLPELLRIGRVGALYCIGVNSQYFAQEGFVDVFKSMSAEQLISQPEFVQQKIYASNDNEHGGDLATVVVYRKL